MSFQESLTFLFDALALGFIFIATIDLSREIIILYKQTFISRQKTNLLTSRQPQQLPQLPDPWLLPTAEAITPVESAIALVELAQVQPKPILLIASAKAVDNVESSANRVTSKEVLKDIDVDTLKLRDARKLAKLLGIAQKVNGRDQKLAFLRSQITLKLQKSLLLDVKSVVNKELVAC